MRIPVRPWGITALLLSTGCATARLVEPAPQNWEPRVAQATVVVEPFFENAAWKVSTQQQLGTFYPDMAAPMGYPGMGYPGYGWGPSSGMPQDVVFYQQVAAKPVYARPEVLAREQARVIALIQQLRPGWRVLSTSSLSNLTGPVVLIRTIVGSSEVVGSNRTLKELALGFGVLLPPLWLFEITPVEETQRVHGTLLRYPAQAEQLRPKLLRYASQPDFAVDTRGLTSAAQPFGLDVAYQEGVLASESSRDPVLVEGFCRKLATATVAFVEGIR